MSTAAIDSHFWGDLEALTWQLYLDSPSNLALVFHLHWTQQRGFARMVLPSPSPPAPGRRDAQAFFDRERIESIKVRVFDKRVKIVFEPSGDDHGFVVRCASQPLTGTQRRAFEARMAKDYRITMLSMERRHVR